MYKRRHCLNAELICLPCAVCLPGYFGSTCQPCPSGYSSTGGTPSPSLACQACPTPLAPALQTVYSIGSYGTCDSGQNATNTMFSQYTQIFRRDCSDCQSSYQVIYYKRLSSMPASFSIYGQMNYVWTSTNNNLNTDFKLYNSYADIPTDSNRWTSCNYDDYGYCNNNGVAFPRDCGGSGGQWHTRLRSCRQHANIKYSVVTGCKL